MAVGVISVGVVRVARGAGRAVVGARAVLVRVIAVVAARVVALVVAGPVVVVPVPVRMAVRLLAVFRRLRGLDLEEARFRGENALEVEGVLLEDRVERNVRVRALDDARGGVDRAEAAEDARLGRGRDEVDLVQLVAVVGGRGRVGVDWVRAGRAREEGRGGRALGEELEPSSICGRTVNHGALRNRE